MQTLRDRNLLESTGTTLSKLDDPIVSNGHSQDNDKQRSSSESMPSSHTSDSHQERRYMAKHKLRKLAGKTKQATKRLFNTTGTEERHDDLQGLSWEGDAATQVLKVDPAFNPNQLDTEHRSGMASAAKVRNTLQTVAAGVIHPKQGAKDKAARSTAGRLSKVERPYVSQNMDMEFLEAYDDFSRSQPVASSGKNAVEEDPHRSKRDRRERVERLEAERENLRAAHTMRRHVQRVRVVPKRQIKSPAKQHFMERNNNGEHAGYDWLRWIGLILVYYAQDFSAQYIDDFDELPFDIESLQLQVERLALASAPWQEALRESMQRTHDQRSNAYQFGELVDKHGRKHWLEPLLDELGPFMQLQLNDMGNMLEVFANFYAWVYPRKTAASLLFVLVCFLLTVLTDMVFCMKIASFIIGGCFFLCWPIASRYPKYRYLVSPFKWVLWDIPTNAEWSFQYLRRNAQTTREKLIERAVDYIDAGEKDGRPLSRQTPNITVNGIESGEDEDWHSASSSTSILNRSDVVSYRAFSQGVIGRLIVYSAGVRFVRSVKRKEVWRHSFLELAEMRKQDGSAVSKLPRVSSQSLELKFIDSSKIVVEGMRERDAAFSSIIGLSGLQWQSLQAKTINADSSFSL
ncbi:MAG: hypothetical protein Q9224_002241 [Gallowayella concinna]